MRECTNFRVDSDRGDMISFAFLNVFWIEFSFRKPLEKKILFLRVSVSS
jgi:hypothetical protein